MLREVYLRRLLSVLRTMTSALLFLLLTAALALLFRERRFDEALVIGWPFPFYEQFLSKEGFLHHASFPKGLLLDYVLALVCTLGLRYVKRRRGRKG
ncbi:hypothetical protein FUAX_36590 [Fulvitalea axinellae]|uniref:Uncharacterized protein n=1 Tax=Fulvitalea axinellae TaxID=1182444 RepID=A0AAU9D0M9_9BACT|nr:hypothetical protein FUAX_36590 [Fulvitalea axinellae]